MSQLHIGTPLCCRVQGEEDQWCISWPSRKWDKEVWKYLWALSDWKTRNEKLSLYFHINGYKKLSTTNILSFKQI